MKIQVVTEGTSEVASFPAFLSQVAARSGNVLPNPLKLSVSPDANPDQIARAAIESIKIARIKGAACVILVLDRESQPARSGDLASALERAVGRHAPAGSPEVRVVLKDKMYENWLIADVQGLRSHRGRFTVNGAFERKVAPDKADNCDAYRLLSNAAIGRAYEKVSDSKRIVSTLDVVRAAANSRSFRHFLHMLGDPSYIRQCSRP